jgi:hypothetical protein
VALHYSNNIEGQGSAAAATRRPHRATRPFTKQCLMKGAGGHVLPRGDCLSRRRRSQTPVPVPKPGRTPVVSKYLALPDLYAQRCWHHDQRILISRRVLLPVRLLRRRETLLEFLLRCSSSLVCLILIVCIVSSWGRGKTGQSEHKNARVRRAAAHHGSTAVECQRKRKETAKACQDLQKSLHHSAPKIPINVAQFLSKLSRLVSTCTQPQRIHHCSYHPVPHLCRPKI